MTRSHPLDLADVDPIERFDDDCPTRGELVADDFEPADFDDRRIAERFGVPAGGFFAFETFDHPDFEEVGW